MFPFCRGWRGGIKRRQSKKWQCGNRMNYFLFMVSNLPLQNKLFAWDCMCFSPSWKEGLRNIILFFGFQSPLRPQCLFWCQRVQMIFTCLQRFIWYVSIIFALFLNILVRSISRYNLFDQKAPELLMLEHLIY